MLPSIPKRRDGGPGIPHGNCNLPLLAYALVVSVFVVTALAVLWYFGLRAEEISAGMPHR